MSALRFFYKNPLENAEAAAKIPMMREIDRSPDVLSPAEVKLLLRAVEHIKYRAALSLVYASGLRVSEVVQLRLKDIESQRMVIHLPDIVCATVVLVVNVFQLAKIPQTPNVTSSTTRMHYPHN